MKLLLKKAQRVCSLVETKNARNIFPPKPGVYAIVNEQNWRYYIGSSCGKQGIRSRLQSHISHLRRGTSCSPALQAAYDKHGPERFAIYILELTQDARDRERYYIEKYQPWKKGYNSVAVVDDKFTPSEKTRDKLRVHNSREYALEHEGVVYKGTNLTGFCSERGLHQGAMTQVNLGRKRQYKGWTQPGKGLMPTRLIYLPTATEYDLPYFGIQSFAKEHGLNTSSLNKLYSGKVKIFKGWTLKGARISDEELRVSLLDWEEIRRRNGRKAKGMGYAVARGEERYEGSNRLKFCREQGLSYRRFLALCAGQIKSYEGFTPIST